eukprot:TRINITY_DN71324_c0_g1_i1.p1 TRINITY_DN71324_c0_g1~~TRINITY_DN71324_c0_g1_i1.p1  ORF type:complete len:515 (-),score=94.16 TRINITY_DN71324_c0_g1_i1:75-1619(-)
MRAHRPIFLLVAISLILVLTSSLRFHSAVGKPQARDHRHGGKGGGLAKRETTHEDTKRPKDREVQLAKPPPKAAQHAAPKEGAAGVADDSLVAPAVEAPLREDFKKALEAFAEKAVGPPVEMSSASFIDFREPEKDFALPANAEQRDKDDRKWRACDPTSTNYTSETDRLCTQYLSNRHNLLRIKPMSSILSFARTLKLKATLAHSPSSSSSSASSSSSSSLLKAVMKVSQRKFLFEPYSELLGYWVDRILGMNRVPPTGWVEMPVDWLRAAVAHMPNEYVRWLQQYVLDNGEIKAAMRRGGGGGGGGADVRFMSFSLQLWMHDVHSITDTQLQIPHDYLRYCDSRMAAVPAKYRNGIGEMSDLTVFDFIIGNTDRGFGKNNYAVGGCKPSNCPKDPSQRHRGPPQLIHLDQGSAFYKRPGPQGNPLTPAQGSNSTFCRFRRRTGERLLALANRKGRPKSETLWGQLKANVPAVVFRFVKDSRVYAAQDRLDLLVKHIRQHCLVSHTESEVFAL